MNTIMIWDCGEFALKFVVFDGDYSRFNRVYINAASDDKLLQQELTELMYNSEGLSKVLFLEEFPTNLVTPNTKVIVSGFLP